MKKIFQLPTIMTSFKSLKDGGAEVRFHTRELSEPEAGLLWSMRNKEVWLAMQEQEIKPDEIEVRDEKVERFEKSPSQRLRATLYVLWEQTGSALTFEQYYREKMEGLIEKLKEKLD